MKRKMINSWAVLFLVLIVVNLLLYKYGITAPENPEDYCATRTIVSEASCIADLPGQFGIGAIRALSLLLLLVYPVLYVGFVRAKSVFAKQY